MKFDGYDLTVLVDGHVLPEVQHHHKTIVVAKPGSEFAVRVARGLQAGSINGEVQVRLYTNVTVLVPWLASACGASGVCHAPYACRPYMFCSMQVN